MPKRKVAGPIAVGTALTIAHVAELQARLSAALAESRVAVDLSEVRQVDGAGLQLLAALQLEANRRSLPLEWLSPPDIIVEGARLLGLQDMLALGVQNDSKE